MKKIYYLFCLAVAVMAAACTHEEEDLFSKSSAERADEAIVEVKDVLANATNGWVLEYYPQSQMSYGGYNVLAKFDREGNVKMASDIAKPTESATSLYSVKQSGGVMLTFDTYNEIFHLFSDPAGPLGGNAGEGLEGDYEFLVLEHSAEMVKLKGKKTGNIMTMVPAQASWSDFITKIQNMENGMTMRKYTLTVGETEVLARASYRTLSMSYESEGTTVSETYAYIVTEKGMKFYTPVNINGTEFTELIYDATTEKFTSNTGNATMVKIFPTPVEHVVEGNWWLSYNNAGAFGQACIDKANQALGSSYGFVLQEIMLGSGYVDSFGVNIFASGYFGLMGLAYAAGDETTLGLQFNGTFDSQPGNGSIFYQAGAAYLLNMFGHQTPKWFNVQLDDNRNPTMVQLTDLEDPTNVMIFTSTQSGL